MADWSKRRYGDTLRHAAVWSSAKPTPHSTMLWSLTNVHQLRLRLQTIKLDAFTLRHKMTKNIIRSNWWIQTPPQGDSKISSDLSLITSPHFTSLRWTDNNIHNDTVNLHAQNCRTHKLHNQTHPKISKNVYKSKHNLVANDVYVSHTEFTIIIADQLIVGQ